MCCLHPPTTPQSEVRDVDEPVPSSNSEVYEDELHTILSILFRCGIAEIIFGVFLDFFALYALIWPFVLGSLAVVFGCNAVCHYREIRIFLSNGCCCCQPLTSVLVHSYIQPFMAAASLGAAGSAIFEIQRKVKGEDPQGKNEPADIALSSVALLASFCLLVPCVLISRVTPRFVKMAEVHQDIGDPSKIREHSGNALRPRNNNTNNDNSNNEHISSNNNNNENISGPNSLTTIQRNTDESIQVIAASIRNQMQRNTANANAANDDDNMNEGTSQQYHYRFPFGEVITGRIAETPGPGIVHGNNNNHTDNTIVPVGGVVVAEPANGGEENNQNENTTVPNPVQVIAVGLPVSPREMQ